MNETITISGLVATTPRHITTAEGVAITSFRLASALRRFDRKKKEWVDAGTNWYTVSTYRQLALNVASSVHKSDRVLVTGRLKIREWAEGDKRGLNIDIDADALGHDLTWGKAVFTRSLQSSGVEGFAASQPDEPDADPDTVDAGAVDADAVDADSSTEEWASADSANVESRTEAGEELEPATPF